MAIKRKLQQKVPQIEIDLTGPQGNVFVLIKLAKDLSFRLGIDGEKVISRMRRVSYEDAVKIFDAYFGDYVTLHIDETVDL